MEDLQLVLFVLGAIAIVAVLVHGFWSIRRQQPKTLKDSPMGNFYKKQADRGDTASKRVDADGFDTDGIGAVRVRKADETSHDTPAINPYLKQEAKVDPKPEPKPLFKQDLNLDVKPEIRQEPMLQQPDFSLQSPTAKELHHRGPKASRQEPVLTGQTAHLGQSHAAIIAQKAAEEEQRAHAPVPTQTALFADEDVYQEENNQDDDYVEEAAEEGFAEPRDVLVLHVVAKEGQQLNGAELLPCFLTLNFKYGEMNIFHRHVDNAGNGKVLFSIANMLKPGVFDPDNMEQFSTQGVVFFMTLPCYGDALMNFSIMLNSAHQLADDIDAVVLDGQRQPWGEFTKQDYLHRIRANA